MSNHAVHSIRPVREEDLDRVIALFRRYARELLAIDATLTAAAIRRDGFGRKFDMVVAEETSSASLVGFAAWQNAYDLHWGISGAIVLDLSVEPGSRGYGLAPRMLSLAAHLVRQAGGTFLAGQAVAGPGRSGRLYRKIAVAHEGTECILGGKAFQAFAELAASSAPSFSPRRFVKGLPPREWNFLPAGG